MHVPGAFEVVVIIVGDNIAMQARSFLFVGELTWAFSTGSCHFERHNAHLPPISCGLSFLGQNAIREDVSMHEWQSKIRVHCYWFVVEMHRCSRAQLVSRLGRKLNC
nr:hypothetical protein CFP56_38890 [Quercus suber]